MRIDWRNDEHAPVPCRVVNLDTGKQLHYCAMADEETGEYIQYAHEGERFLIDPETGQTQTITGHASLRIDILKPGEPYLLDSVTL